MQSQNREAQSLWAAWSNLSLQDDILYFQFDGLSPKRAAVPPPHTMGLLRELHNQLGLIGRNKLEKSARKRFWSPYLRRDVAAVCASCDTCHALKPPPVTPRAPLQPIPSGYPHQRLGVDIVGPFPQSKHGNVYLLVMVDFFS